MKIGIVGGGPAGLYFALLMKRRNPAHEIRVVEQSAADATYGWGVVFSDRALSYLAESDAASYRDVEASLQTWDDQMIVHQGQQVVIDGLGFSGIARLRLLRILQAHCRESGVDLQFETRLTDLEPLGDCDLIVGADGANSIVRQRYAAKLQPEVQILSNKYVWYGTQQRFDCLTLTFRENADGVFVAHHYRYSDSGSTFIVECDADTWARAGFAVRSEDESRRYCERVFRDDLGGHPLLTNKSLWFNFKLLTNRHWHCDNVVLIGDALRTVHFSIGSGTRMALEDAIMLARAFALHTDVPAALQQFERLRRPAVDKFLRVAAHSSIWYERMRDKLPLAPVAFAYDYMMRSGTLTHARLRERSPKFAAACDAHGVRTS